MVKGGENGRFTGDHRYMDPWTATKTSFKVISNSNQRGRSETFTLEDLGPSKISLLSYQGKYLAAEVDYEMERLWAKYNYQPRLHTKSNKINVINGDGHDTKAREFTVEQQTGGTIALKTMYGFYVVPGYDGDLRGDSQSTVAGTKESFTPECVSGIHIFYENKI